MKTLVCFLLLLFNLTLGAFSQTNDDNYAPFEHPIIKQALAKSANLVVYGVKNNAKWINIAILDKPKKYLYWICCTGFVVDKSNVSELAYNRLLKKELDPFEYHQTLWESGLGLVDAAIYKLRFPNTIVHYDGVEGYDGFVQQELQAPNIRSAKTQLEKLKALYKERQIHLLNLAWCKARNPGGVFFDTTYSCLFNKKTSGLIETIGSPDTAKIAVFCAKNLLSPVCKAILNTTTSKLYYFTQDRKVFDSLNILPKRTRKLITENTDVFALYQSLNAWRLSQADSIAQLLDKYENTPNRKPGIAIQALFRLAKGNSKAIRLSIFQAQKRYLTNLDAINGIDTAYIEQNVLYDFHKTYAVTIGAYAAGHSADGTETGDLFVGQLVTETRGEKQYELTDARGNVMAVVTDKKIPHSSDGVNVDYYEADVVKATDYSSFGASLPGRTFQIREYEYGYNGKRDDAETGYQDYGNRMYDPNIGRFITPDPITKSFPELTPYQFASNTPIQAIDLDGLEKYTVTGEQAANLPPALKVPNAINIENESSARVAASVQMYKNDVIRRYMNYKSAKLEYQTARMGEGIMLGAYTGMEWG